MNTKRALPERCRARVKADHLPQPGERLALREQAARGVGDDAPAARRGERGEEHRRLFRALEQGARAEPHAERAPGLSEGDIVAQHAAAVLALEGDEVAARTVTLTSATKSFNLAAIRCAVLHAGAPAVHAALAALPSHLFGIISLIALAIALLARYSFRMKDSWRWIYAVTALFALYLNVFVLVAQDLGDPQVDELAGLAGVEAGQSDGTRQLGQREADKPEADHDRIAKRGEIQVK